MGSNKTEVKMATIKEVKCFSDLCVYFTENKSEAK